MKRIFLVDGRLAWPLVVTTAALTATLVVFDFAWRTLSVSFEALALVALLAVAAELACISLASLLLRRR
jgi:hypothetical protein